MTDVCIECEHFHNRYRPLKGFGGVCDSGFAECDKYDLCIDYVSTKQLKRLRCVEERKENNVNVN